MSEQMNEAPAATVTESKPIEAPRSVSQADIEAVRDLFALAHDLIAQSTYPAHMHQKLASVLNFLSFQYNDFKRRAEALAPKVAPAAEAKA